MAALTYLDTHVAVWAYAGTLQRFSAVAQEVLRERELVISPMVLLEIEYLREIGRITQGGFTVYSELHRLIGLNLCPLPFAKVVERGCEERWTRDPFDRLIVAHAGMSDADLLTRDEGIRLHYARAIW